MTAGINMTGFSPTLWGNMWNMFLSALEKQEVLEVLDQYHQGMIPLIVPLSLMKFFARKFKQDYLANQHYLDPHPLQLMLLNHA